MKKLSKIDESVWGDIRRRGNGSVEKQEDAFTPEYIDFGVNTTVYWAVENLQIENKVKFTFDEVKDYNNNGWRLPTYKEVEEIDWTGARIKHNIGYKNIIFNDGNELKIVTKGEGGSRMWTKDPNEKYPTGATGYDAEGNEYNFNKSNTLFVFLVKDKNYVNESVWNDIRKRGTGDDIKKEDDITNIKDIKPLDMGGSVLWADNDLALKDGFCYFSFDEAFELVKDSGWRLPTLEEVAELDVLYNRGSYCSDSDAFYFKYNGNVLIFEKKGFIYLTASDSPIDFDFYYCWTSSLYDNGSAHILTFDNDHPIHSPLNNKRIVDQVIQVIERGKLCVRLVKDK